jgi:hypothetical protein
MAIVCPSDSLSMSHNSIFQRGSNVIVMTSIFLYIGIFLKRLSYIYNLQSLKDSGTKASLQDRPILHVRNCISPVKHVNGIAWKVYELFRTILF